MRKKNKLIIGVSAVISLIILISGYASSPLEGEALIPKETTPTSTPTLALESTPTSIETEILFSENFERSEGSRKRENIKLLNKDSQKLLELADSIEKRFGPEQWPAKPAYIRKFVEGIPAADASQATKIIDVLWHSNPGIIEITLNAFPSWDNWTMYVDGEEVPMEGGAGNPVVRPNAALDKPPTGLLVGTEPWVTGLAEVDFPCCGTIQFDIPGEGLTNEYEFNLVDFGCETASEKECPSEWIKHHGDLVISGTETMIIENEKYLQQGNIYINDEAKLILRNSQLAMGRGDVATIHVYIFVSENTSLEIENSLIFPHSGLVCVFNHGKVNITDSPTSIHYFDMSKGAELTITNSEMVFTIGGLLQVTGGDTTLIDSTIGALGLRVPANAHLDVDGLESGVYFELWDVHEMIPEADYNLVLERTRILKDDFTGELEHGPYERGWLFFLDPNAHVRISDSELRKVFISLVNENVSFENLRVGIPSSLNYRDIELTDVIIMGQWSFTITDSNVTISNSDYLFLQPSGKSTVSLVNSHMCEFIPRNFFGTMIFENGLWTTAGEIIGGVPYHSMENDFTMKGSLKIEGVRENLKWSEAQVTREYDVVVRDETGNPIKGALIKIDGKTFVSDDAGKAKFSLILTDRDYLKPRELEALRGDTIIARRQIDFFTETPIMIKSTYAQDNPDVATGLAFLGDRLLMAYGYKAGEGVGGWTVYNPEWAVAHPEWNTLTTLYVQRGYWINVSEGCDLTYGANTYELDEGWNLIGWCGATAVGPPSAEDNPDVAIGLDFIKDQLIIAYGYKAGEGVGGWTVYNPEWAGTHPEWNSLTTLHVGRGYWINVEEACSLEYGTQVYGLDAGWNLIGWLGW